MQIEQSGNSQNVELAQRLKLGGRWYGRPQVVALDSADAEALISRGIACKARPGAKPVNIEVLKPAEVSVQTKGDPEESEQHKLQRVAAEALQREERELAQRNKDRENAQRSAKKR